MIPTLTTDRLALRPATRADFDGYAAMLADARTEYMGGPFDRQGAWDMFCNMIASWQLSGFGGWLVDTDGAMIGEIAIWHPHHFPEPELGWTLIATAEGKGYGAEAAQAALTWYWANTDAPSIVSYISPANTRSAALATRLGAQRDAHARLPVGETPDETHVYRHARAA